MKSNLIALVALSILLLGCVTTRDQTVPQQYYALKQDYATVLTAVTTYRKNCDSFRTTTCVKIVRDAQAADKQVAAFIKLADKAMVENDNTKLVGYIESIKGGVTHLKSLIVQ